MIWIPDINYILEVFEERIEKPFLMNRSGLEGTLDKVIWGIPYQPKPDIFDRATILYKELVTGHYFADGNKRIGLLVATIFLEVNGYKFDPGNDSAYDMTIKVAQGLKSFKEIKEWLGKNSIKLGESS